MSVAVGPDDSARRSFEIETETATQRPLDTGNRRPKRRLVISAVVVSAALLLALGLGTRYTRQGASEVETVHDADAGDTSSNISITRDTDLGEEQEEPGDVVEARDTAPPLPHAPRKPPPKTRPGKQRRSRESSASEMDADVGPKVKPAKVLDILASDLEENPFAPMSETQQLELEESPFVPEEKNEKTP